MIFYKKSLLTKDRVESCLKAIHFREFSDKRTAPAVDHNDQLPCFLATLYTVQLKISKIIRPGVDVHVIVVVVTVAEVVVSSTVQNH